MSNHTRESITDRVRLTFLDYVKTGDDTYVNALTLEEMKIAQQGLGVDEQNTEYRRALKDFIADRESSDSETRGRIYSTDSIEALDEILVQLKVLNTHLSLITGAEISREDLE